MEADEIISRREALGLSRRDLAREIGVNHATLWRWEAGRFKATPLIAKRLEQTLARLERRRPAARQGEASDGE